MALTPFDWTSASGTSDGSVTRDHRPTHRDRELSEVLAISARSSDPWEPDLRSGLEAMLHVQGLLRSSATKYAAAPSRSQRSGTARRRADPILVPWHSGRTPMNCRKNVVLPSTQARVETVPRA